MQRPKQTVEKAYRFLVVIVIHCYAFRYDVNCDYILRRQAKKRKTEDVDLLLWHTPALSGLAGPTYRCYAKKPTLPLWHAWADMTSFPASFARWIGISIGLLQEACHSSGCKGTVFLSITQINSLFLWTHYAFCKKSATSRRVALVNNYHFMCLHGGQLRSPS